MRFLTFIPTSTINRAMTSFSHSLAHPVRFYPNAFLPVWEHWLVGGIGWIPAALLLLEISSRVIHPALRYSFLKFYILRRAGSLPCAATFWQRETRQLSSQVSKIQSLYFILSHESNKVTTLHPSYSFLLYKLPSNHAHQLVHHVNKNTQPQIFSFWTQ